MVLNLIKTTLGLLRAPPHYGTQLILLINGRGWRSNWHIIGY